MVWDAYKSVRRKRGSGGVDKVSLEEFEEDIENNLYKLWNRLSSGSYFPPAVKAVPIPKKSGGERILGVPTVGDRVAQTVVKQFIEPQLEPLFHPDSYGYRPNKSALDAVGQVRQRCGSYNWVLEFDIKGLFDNICHFRLMKATSQHVKDKWVHLYIWRWLQAPMSREGEIEPRLKGVGTPQGSCVSPLLSNLFLHYAFDRWMVEHFPSSPFVRYADDGVVHCRTRKEAIRVKRALRERFKEVGLEIHPQKTHIIYCQQSGRPKQKGEKVNFDFLGYTFKPRPAKNHKGQDFISFIPAVSRESKAAMNKKIRKAKVRCSSHLDIDTIAEKWNSVLRGWYNYYGRFYSSAFHIVLTRFNSALILWAKRTLKSLKGSYRRAYRWLKRFAKAKPGLFWHWRIVPP